MTELVEGRLRFSFPDTSEVTRYETWTFCRRQFQNRCREGNKAVDFICLHGQDVWFIEVKDYRLFSRSKEEHLVDEVAQKVRDTLAGVAAAVRNANNDEERRFAQRLFGQTCARVILHLEQPRQPSRLRPRLIDKANVLDQLRRRLKAVGRVYVVDQQNMPPRIPWVVKEKKNSRRNVTPAH